MCFPLLEVHHKHNPSFQADARSQETFQVTLTAILEYSCSGGWKFGVPKSTSISPHGHFFCDLFRLLSAGVSDLPQTFEPQTFNPKPLDPKTPQPSDRRTPLF